jgi:diguanylate cyclase
MKNLAKEVHKERNIQESKPIMERDLQALVCYEYERSRQKWRKYHFRFLVIIVLVVFCVEVAMYFILHVNRELATDAPHYCWKYVAIPTLCNITALIACQFLCKQVKNEKGKDYITSFTMLFASFIITVVHCVFVAVYTLFIVPVACSVLYWDKKLTTAVFSAAMVCLSVSAFGILYDSSAIRMNGYFYNIMFYLLILLSVYVACMFSITWERTRRFSIIKHEQLRRRFQTQALCDELTGIHNRYALRSYFEKLVKSGMENYWFAMLDIDNFKRINDTFGHQVGDKVLRQIGLILQEKDSRTVRCFRYGGDEFGIILLCKNEKEAVGICQTIYEGIRSIPFPKFGVFAFSASIGLAHHIAGQRSSVLIQHADEAMYCSKHEKNKITVYTGKKALT